MDKNIAIGADIGGSHISCAAVDLSTGKILKETLTGRSVNNQAQANVIIGVWAEALKAVLSKIPSGSVTGIGFAMPGPFDYVKGISYIKGVTKYENLYGINITDAIASSLDAPDDFLIRFMNDASAFAVGEAWAGSAAKTNRSLAITLGTGFGSAFISKKIPIVDGPEVPKLGCIYHIPYREGIADDYFSTRWFISSYKKATGAAEMTDYRGSGQSVMEMSHRSPVYEQIIAETQALVRSTLNVPDNYKVLFLQGGASMQFSAVPLNLMNGSGKADYVLSGQFSSKAYEEAKRFGDVKVLASSKDKNFSYVPEFQVSDIRPDADYVHICYNNTIFGSRFPRIPDTGNVPLVGDLSSCIMSEPIDISRFALVYAGAQKNMAPAGLTVVIVRDDMIGHERDTTPLMLSYKVAADNESMYNTPPCYAIYIAKLVMEWLRDDIGGVEKMAEINNRKAGKLYACLDSSGLFKATVQPGSRSIMNVCFVTGDDELDKRFCKEAEQAGFVNIKGHRSVGGMRASIYNAMPEEGIDALIQFMMAFEKHVRG